MGSLFPNPQTGFTFIGSGRVNGIWVEGTKEPISFTGTIQPMTGKEIENLIGARENRGMVKIYTGYEFKISEEGTDQNSDFVNYAGKEWELITKLPYSSNLINHNKYVAALREERT